MASKMTRQHKFHPHLLYHVTGLNLSLDRVAPSLGVWTHLTARVAFSPFPSVSLH